jgi:hypothetical protein
VKLRNRRNLAGAGTKGAATQRAEPNAFAANVLLIVRQIEAAGGQDPSCHRRDPGTPVAFGRRGAGLIASTVRNLPVRFS